jgi:hypothetical protein
MTDETYDLKGLNLVSPDQVMPPGETPFAINNRRYADNDNETSVAMRTRRGSITLSTPVGEALNAQNVDTVTGDIEITPGKIVAVPFTATATGVLTKLALQLKKTQNTRGYLLVEVYSDVIGLPGTSVAQSSIKPNQLTGSYADAFATVMDAPDMVNGSQYWLVLKMQDLGVGSYYLAQTATGNLHTSVDDQKTWVATTYTGRFKTYISTGGFIKGFTKRYPEDTTPLTMFSMGTKLYTMPNSPAVPTELGTDLIAVGSDKTRFVNIDERTFIVDASGTNALLEWNGTGTPAANPAVLTTLGNPINAIIVENRLLTIPANDRTRIEFSALYDFVTPFPSVNFFYIGRPKSEDWITAWQPFRDGTTVFTKETKYTLTGSEISTFIPTPHEGTKGAISQEATAVGKAAIYFLADDRNVYAWNGTNDTLISRKVWPELKKILDLDKVRFEIYNNQLRIYYNRNPDSSVQYMLLYDIAEDQWYRDTGRAVMGAMEWNFDNNELVEFSSRGGWLFTGEQGYSDLGKAISFKYWTNYKTYGYKRRNGQTFGGASSKKRIKRFRPLVRPSDSSYYLNVGKDMDFQNRPQMRPWLVDSGGAKWGTFNWGDGTTFGGSQLIDNTSAMSGRGKHVQYRFEYEGIDTPVLLLGYIALIKIGRSR